MADALSSLTPEQWAAPSWCEGWSVQQAAGHILAAAEQTFPNFYKELGSARFRFDTFTTRGATRLGALPADALVGRLRARTSTTNRPPAPVIAMLGEIVVHGDDIRRIDGLALQATDVDWSHGAGPAVTGPLQSLVLAMVGRRGALIDLSGEGLDLLASRS
jgi:uncharacterized protein (TIGR03083 family)